jgi:hypothetical protein
MATDLPGPKPDATIGVLFVHGMGNHHRGSVLRQFGEPLQRWFHGWLGEGRAGAPKRLHARSASFLVPRPDDLRAPAHVELDLEIPGPNGTPRLVRWIAVDGWWQDEIVQPPFAQVASWGLGLAPWMIARHVRQRAKGLLVPLALPLVVLFQVVILLLSLLAIVPQLREPVARLQLAITGSLGDVMVMVASPLQLAAMVTRLRRYLAWLWERVDGGPIAVIAHSQGTGLARAAMMDSEVPVNLFVTFGAALEKLRIAGEVQRNRRRLALGSSLSIAGIVLLALALATWLAADDLELTGFDRADRWARWLLAAGTVTLLAVMGLWFHLQRWYAVALAAVGVLLVLDGMALFAGGSLTASDRRIDAFLAIVRHPPLGWDASSPLAWGGLAMLGAGVALMVVRTAFMVSMRERNALGGPDSHATWVPEAPGRAVYARFADPTSPFGNFVTAVALIAGLFLIALASGEPDAPVGPAAPVIDAIVLLTCAGLAFCFAAVPIPVPGITEAQPGEFRLPIDRPEPLWLNFWAPGDLVPDDDLPNPIGGEPYVHNYRVRNQDSLLTDHTTYPENTEEFLTRLGAALARLVPWTLIAEQDALVVARAQGRRRARVYLLTVARWTSVAGMFGTWWVLGETGLTALGKPLESALSWILSILPEVTREAVRGWVSAPLLGAVVVLGITVFWYRTLLVAAWRYWDDVEATWLFQRGMGVNGIAFERRVASLVFAIGSVAGLASAIWSPNLLALADRHLGLVALPSGAWHAEGSWRHYLRETPWTRGYLPEFAVWGLSWIWIGVITLSATLVWWVTIRALASWAESGRLFRVKEPVLLPAPPGPTVAP